MKTNIKSYILFLFCIFLVAIVNTKAQSNVRKLYKEIKHMQGAEKLSLPGIVLKLGAGIAKNQLDEDEKDSKMFLDLLKKVKKIKMASVTSKSIKQNNKLISIMNEGRNNNKLNELIYFRDDKSQINLMLKDKEKVIKNIFLQVKEGDEFSMFSIKTKIKYSELSKIINYLIQDSDSVNPIDIIKSNKKKLKVA